MMEKTVIYPVSTKWGVFRLIISKKGLVALSFPKPKIPYRNRVVPARIKRVASLLERELAHYVKTGSVNIKKIPTDFTLLTPMQKKMCTVISKIPPGETRTYEWLAAKCGIPKGARAIGGVLGSNPMPVFFPCHRIVRKDGSLGGFSSGINWKRRLLEHEKAQQLY